MMFIGLGCTASYRIGVNGYSSTGQSLSIPDGSSFSVVTDSNAPNPIFQKEVGTKIRKMLADMGYSDNGQEPEYSLQFDYGIDSGRTITGAIPIYHRRYYYEHPFSPFYSHGYTAYMPYSSVVYTRWLVLELFDGKAYAESPEAEPLWICEVVSTGGSSDLRETIDYLLAAAFEHFGQDTSRQIVEVVRRDDERVRAIAEY
jgi:hypothetical protein